MVLLCTGQVIDKKDSLHALKLTRVTNKQHIVNPSKHQRHLLEQRVYTSCITRPNLVSSKERRKGSVEGNLFHLSNYHSKGLRLRRAKTASQPFETTALPDKAKTKSGHATGLPTTRDPVHVEKKVRPFTMCNNLCL
jgi:hypothetical protein